MYEESRENTSENLKNYAHDDIKEVNKRIDNLFDKTNNDINFLKNMVSRLENLIVGHKQLEEVDSEKGCSDVKTSNNDGVNKQDNTVIERDNDKFIQKYQENLKLKTEEIDSLKQSLIDKNQEISQLNDLINNLEEEKGQQNQTINDLDSNFNNRIQEIEQLNSAINNLEKEKVQQNQIINDLDVRLNNRVQEISKLNNLIVSLNEEKEQQNQTIDELDQMLNNKNQEIGELNSLIDSLEEEKAQQNQKLAEINVEIEKRNQKINELVSMIGNLEDEKEQQNQKNDELVTVINKRNQEINQLNNLINHLEEERSKQNQNIDKLDANINSIQQQYNQLEAWNNIYHPVMEKIYNCMALKAFVEENRLGNSINLGTTLQFIKCIGNDYRFAHRIYNAFATYKREIQEPLTEAELAVYKAINEYYRNVKNLSFDIFVMPDGLNIGDDFNYKIAFDKSEVKDMMDSCNVNFKSIQCVYVPILRTQDGKVALQGIVKGSMDY